MSELEVATNVIRTYLSKNINIESLNDLYEINIGNKKILKSHIDALKNIFEKASMELDKVLGDEE